MKCRHCNSPLQHKFVDLGFAPPSNAYLREEDLKKPEKYYPLKAMVCINCWLVQTEDFADAEELFNPEYAYFSSVSSSWLLHAKNYVEKITNQLTLDKNSFVVEVASNDGYLLRNFVDAGVPCLGIEPTKSTADQSEKIGVPVLRQFFGEPLGRKMALENKQADLIIGNNVYAHVPDINDFTKGLKALLKPSGTITLEFPHLLQLIKHFQFDTIYHEHFSYLSLFTVSQIFTKFGLRVYHVEKLLTHGGSLRVFGCHENDPRKNSEDVNKILSEENVYGLQDLNCYLNFQFNVDRIKNDLLDFMIQQKRLGKKVVAFGAAAKGNTLLNYAGIKSDLLPYICDNSSSKQGKFSPGSHIPILPADVLTIEIPDYILILPWNISNEIREQYDNIALLGARFFRATPKISFLT